METLDKKLPIWLSSIETDDLEARLDNNWYSPAAAIATMEIRKAILRGSFKIVTLESLCEEGGINTGAAPAKGGTIGIVEGKNLRPNYIIPMFMKHEV